jgi:hypothetical protein
LKVGFIFSRNENKIEQCVPTGCMFLRETMESLVKGAHLRGHALSAGTDDSVYSSFGCVYLLFPVSFPSQDQMIIEVLLCGIFALKRIVTNTNTFDTMKAHNWR